MSNFPVHEIVPPEPHSRGLLGFEEAWKHMPRWLQIIVILTVIGAGLLFILTKT